MKKVTIIHPRLQHPGMTTANIDVMLKWWRDILGMNLAHRTGSATGAHETGSALMTA